MTDIMKSKSELSINPADILSPARAVERYHKEGLKFNLMRSGVPEKTHHQIQLDLLKIARHLGIQNPPDEELLTEIIVFLINNFGDFTRSEIVHAFELYACGKIRTIEIAGKAKEIEKPFGTFNLIFIGEVLQGYRIYRKPLLKSDPVPESHRIEKKSTYTSAEWTKLNFDILNQYMIETKSLNPVGDYSAAFIHMENEGLVRLSIEEKIILRDQYKKLRLEELHKMKIENPFKRFEYDAEIRQLLDDRSPLLIKSVRDYCARLYFNQKLIEIKNEKKEKK